MIEPLISMNSLFRYVVCLLFFSSTTVTSQSSTLDEGDLPNQCSFTFNSVPANINPSFPNANLFICPSICFTRRYLTSHNEYPIYGNQSYSGNSLICKSAWHDGRLSSWSMTNSSVFIRNSSTQSTVFPSALRNGILSSKSTDISFYVYDFVNNRINETSIPDIAVEHRSFLYSSSESSTIVCKSQLELNPIEPIPIDQRWKSWKESPLKSFAFPHFFLRNQSLDFCEKNNATLMFWKNNQEEQLLREFLLQTLFQLFRGQRVQGGNNSLTFFIGWKQINRIKQWTDNIVAFNQSLESNWNSIINQEDYCTMLQFDGSISPTTIRLIDHRCDDTSIRAYPLCRTVTSSDAQFLYRLDTADSKADLNGVIDFCGQAGGYPIYAKNAYEWQLIQEIMFKDTDFTDRYVYTGLRSPTKQVTDVYWTPQNITYNSLLNYVFFTAPRNSLGTAYHLSKADDESYYFLYDLDPTNVFSRLRFCRKDDVRSVSTLSSSCNRQSCRSNCQTMSIPARSDDLRFGFYQCRPKTSLVGIVYTHAFPDRGDFTRENLPMEYGVTRRRSYNETFILNVTQTDLEKRFRCFEYLNLDRQGTLDDTRELFCDASIKVNKIISGIVLKKDFNGLVTIAAQDRRLTGHHFRFIDYPHADNRCRFQGVYHPYINQCICAPGFYGTECQFTCPTGYYGQSCSFYCSGNAEDFCRGLLICLPDPYGCSCYSGWYGTRCNLSCPVDRYGPDCSYQCPCDNCNRFTGVCDCNGTECYQGVYTRVELQSKCSSSNAASNLALIIVLPIVGAALVLSAIGLFVYWKVFRGKEGRKGFSKSRQDFSPTSTSF